MIQLAKSAIVTLFGLQVVVFAANNVANFSIAIEQVRYVMSQTGHEVYPTSLAPALSSDAIVYSGLCFIIICEFLAGFLLLKGGFDMFRAAGKSAEEFEASKKGALLGCLAAIGVWFGLFVVVGGALFQMWQTPLGRGSFNDSVTMFIIASILYLLTRSPEPKS